MKIGLSSQYVQRRIRETVHNQTQPLQLFVVGAITTVIVVCVLVFGVAYEADSMVITEHELETANATAVHLELSNAVLGRRLKVYSDKARREIEIADDHIKHLKQRHQECTKLLTKCSKTEAEESDELKTEKTTEEKLEKRAEDLQFMLNMKSHELQDLQNHTKRSNATMQIISKQLEEERALFEKDINRLKQANEELTLRLESQQEELIAEVAAKESGRHLLQFFLGLSIAFATGLIAIAYAKRNNASWLPAPIEKCLDPPRPVPQRPQVV